MEAAKTKIKYVQFPLFMMQGINANKVDTFQQILTYGIYRFSKQYKVSKIDAGRQVIYENYRGKLPKDIIKRINALNLKLFGNDGDYNGFTDDSFDPVEELDELIQAMNDNEILLQLCSEFYSVHLALKSLKRQTDNFINLSYKLSELVKNQDKPLK